MKIRSKVVGLLAALFVVLGAAGALVAAYIVLPSFAELERADAHTAMRRIDYALGMALDHLAVSATDWGNWADTYQYVLDKNPEFVTANLTPLALRQLGVNVLLIVDRGGNVVRSSELDLEGEQPLGLDFAARKALPPDFPWRADQIGVRPDLPDRGLLRTNRGILMLAAAPVLDGHGQGPARGMVILGRLLSPTVVKDIGARAQAALTMLPAPPAGGMREQLVESADITYIYRAFDDLYGQPAMILRVDIPRAITARGRTAARYASAYLLGAALVVVILLMLALDRLVLGPLSVVTRHAIAVGQDTDLSTRLSLSSQDEIGVLAREFDRMVERVAKSRDTP